MYLLDTCPIKTTSAVELLDLLDARPTNKKISSKKLLELLDACPNNATSAAKTVGLIGRLYDQHEN